MNESTHRYVCGHVAGAARQVRVSGAKKHWRRKHEQQNPTAGRTELQRRLPQIRALSATRRASNTSGIEPLRSASCGSSKAQTRKHASARLGLPHPPNTAQTHNARGEPRTRLSSPVHARPRQRMGLQRAQRRVRSLDKGALAHFWTPWRLIIQRRVLPGTAMAPKLHTTT